MMDYSKGESFFMENVEYDIHILGIKAEFWPFIMFSFLLFLPVNPLLSFVSLGCIGSLSRKIFKLEMDGVPLEYDRNFIKMASTFYLYPHVINPPIILPREAYRG